MSEAGDRRRRVEDLFDEALKLAPEARGAMLRERCGGDEELRREVESLLKHDSAETIAALRSPLVGRGRVGERVGDVIDRYRLDEVVGEGGFGVVYRAHQSEPVTRDVALKVIKAGMDTLQVVARFEAERQALAMMDHPNVARVLDGGATDAAMGGRPYFVMEYVTGQAITAFCDAQGLSIERRLGLFGQVCAAVQHAHQKGIVHRDLKPSNVLVHMSDGRAMVKVIDFGIAKAMGPGGDARTMVTEAGQYIGTPEYMSPEQASGGAVDTRTDIYSLGVILYELLAGGLPIDVSTARQSGFVAIQRAIVEQSPVKPSTRISGAGAQAARRGGDAAGLGRRLRGDLDWIVMRALEKEPERRYASVSELALDVERHLRHEPVLAGPPSVAYRARKFVRRNRVGVAAGAVVVLALAGGAVATTIGFARAVKAEGLARERAEAEARARASAERRFAQVRELARALTHDVHDAVADIPGSTAARKKIVETGMKYADSLVDEARGDMDLAVEVASAYRRLADVLGKPSVANLGDTPGALEAYRKASALLGPIALSLPPDSPGLIEYREALFGEAFMLRATGQTREAIEALRHAGALLEELLSKAPDETRRRLDVETAYVNMARMQEAVGEYEAALAGYRRYMEYLKDPALHGEVYDLWARQSNLATVHLAIGELLKRMGRTDESIATFQEGVLWAQRAIEENPTSLRLQGTLAEVNRLMAYAMFDADRTDEAEEPLLKSARIWNEVSAADPADFRAARNAAIAQYSLGLLAQKREKWEESIGFYQRYGEMIEKVANENPTYLPVRRDVAIASESVGVVHGKLGQFEESAAAHKKALEQYESLREADPNDAQALRDIVGARRYTAGALHRLAEGKSEAEREALRAESMAMIAGAREIVDQMEASGRSAEQLARMRESLDEVAGRWEVSPDNSGTAAN